MAEKPNTLKQCQGNPHMTPRDTFEKKSLQDVTVKRSILDSAVQAQLHPCNNLSVGVKLLEDTINSETSFQYTVKYLATTLFSPKAI